MGEVTWNDLSEVEQYWFRAFPDEWTRFVYLPEIKTGEVKQSFKWFEQVGLIESRDDSREYRRTATGRALVEERIVTNESGLPVALDFDGWQHVGDVKALTNDYDKDSRIQHLLSDRNDMLSDEQKIHEQLALIDRNVDESTVVCVEKLVREFAELEAERDALKAENERLRKLLEELALIEHYANELNNTSLVNLVEPLAYREPMRRILEAARALMHGVCTCEEIDDWGTWDGPGSEWDNDPLDYDDEDDEPRGFDCPCPECW